MENILKRLFFTAVIFLGSVVQAESYFFFSPEKIATHISSYNEEEKADIAKDLAVVRSICFGKKPLYQMESPFYIATAGGPGARKSTILERFLRDFPEYGHAVYLDPDQRGLKFMAHTYYAQSLNAFRAGMSEDYLPVVKAGYEKWRGASNYITWTLMEEALQQMADVAHGTTLTGDHVEAFLQKLKSAGYEIILILCYAEDDVRKTAVEYRNQEQRFYQSTPEDAVLKGKLFPEKLPIYFAYADKLFLFWSDSLFTEARLAAVFDHGEIDKEEDCCALGLFQRKYEQDRESLKEEGKQLPTWHEILTIYSDRYQIKSKV